MQSYLVFNYYYVFINNTCWVSKVLISHKEARTKKSVFRLFVSPFFCRLSTEKVLVRIFLPQLFTRPKQRPRCIHSLVLFLLKPQQITTKRHQKWSRKPSSNKPNKTSNRTNKTPLPRVETNIKNSIIEGILKRLINGK